LDGIVGNSARKIFYKWAYVEPIALADYWFICIRERTTAKRPGSFFNFDLNTFEVVKPSYSVYPERVEYVLRLLSLFDWHQSSTTGAPRYPHIPFVLVVSDSLIASPQPTPSFANLEKVPFTDSESGEEIGETPLIALYLDDELIQRSLPIFMVHVAEQLRAIQRRGPRWNFIDTALGFLVKAFVSKGVDQLLWHITAIEAVLGENVSGGITDKLATRVARIIGEDKARRVSVRAAFKELYHIRSKLVHGDVELTKKEIYNKSLHQGRYSARAVVHWAISYLSHIASAMPDENCAPPTRKVLLKFMDMDLHERQESLLIGGLLSKDFPYVTGWTRIAPASDGDG
jgi:hypothetical protein